MGLLMYESCDFEYNLYTICMQNYVVITFIKMDIKTCFEVILIKWHFYLK